MGVGGAAVAVAASADPHAVDLAQRLSAPSWAQPFGSDHLGRDLAARVVWGAVPSLAAVAIVVFGGVTLGVLAGVAMALGPAPVRTAFRAAAQTALAIPTLVTALALSAAFGAGAVTIAAALLVTSWAPYALSIEALVDGVRREPYWRASEALGAPTLQAAHRHVLPNVWPALGALAGADAGRAVIIVASLGFIGVSADTGRPEWGAMIYEYRGFLFTAPRLVLAPALACALLALALHLILDAPRGAARR